ncbi:hypothetical protein M3936_03775 [Sutcliffiella horikoshii]|uniref:hypothetical protein n=1 Tax=Sutcliffiella horikoshii TaxID=79883 RepID=UPI00203AECF2|nr:hypothetical protein [Sutcliffiella horikoshii]MCM3616696.1 hypothetical protein [Sutcliffiella horikoshii]
METSKVKRKRFMEMALNRVGEVRLNNMGTPMIVDSYKNSQDVWVRFPQGNLVNCTWQSFVNGSVKNPLDRTKFFQGFIGLGKYKPTINSLNTPAYSVWSAMLERCFSEKYKQEHPTYKDVTVCDEWLNFQVFSEWYENNYYQVDDYRMHLDKDILFKGNKVYSPDTCCIIPQPINSLFVKRDKLRGDCPIGVRKNKTGKKFEALVNDGRERHYLGVFSTPEEAFDAYKDKKEEVIKNVAKCYKGRIPDNIYNALMRYTVEISD